MSTNFTSKQREIIARKLGYDGPMQGFDEFIASSPALEAKYNAVTQKYVEKMAKGGVVKKYATGGDTVPTSPVTILPYPLPTEPATGGVTDPAAVTYNDRGVPIAPEAPKLTPETITETPSQIIETTPAPASSEDALSKQVATTAAATATPTAPAETYTATTAAPAVTAAMQAVKPEQGVVSPEAQVQAVTKEPTTTEVGTVQAAQLAEAQRVEAPEERQMQAGETVQSAVDRQRAEQVAQQTQDAAAQGQVVDEMTVQGQMAKLTSDFDAKNPPPWAAGALRAATATMAARGIGASSMAGQAIIQAAIESAIPIASADAQAYQQMALQNLSNKQQMAVLAAQQRAAFTGQEFDQEFQARVTNAAKVSEIANMNFTASQQIALENARMAQTVDLNNLSNQQAVVMAKAAQIAALETQNLSNMQQAAVVNAQSFLAMDMTNLNNAQQTTLFKAQQTTQALLSDQAAENASKQFNASSTNQTNQFNAQLATQVSQFNAAQSNAINQFNVDQANSISKFNAEQQNARDQFNSSQRLVIDQSNAQWRREISTANTAATNAANYLNAQNIQQLTFAEYNNQTQLYRDQIQHAFDSYENTEQRIVQLAAASIAAKASETAASTKATSDMWAAIGTLISKWD